MIISLLEKSSSSVFDQIFNLIPLISSDEEKAHRPYVFENTRVSCCIRTFTRKTKVSSYKQGLVTLYLTRPQSINRTHVLISSLGFHCYNRRVRVTLTA